MSRNARWSTSCFLLVLVWLTNLSNVVGQSYQKFIQRGKVWETSMSGGGNCGAYTYDMFFIADDTLINGISYAKLKIKGMDYPSNYPYRCVAIPQTTSSVFAYLREDTVARKVYEVVKHNASWVEGLYLDFSLSVGDSVPFGTSRKTNYGGLSPYPNFKGDTVVLYLKVRSVDTTNSAGIIPNGRKVIKFQTANQSVINEWTEGVGGRNIPSGFYINAIPEYQQSITKISYNNRLLNGDLILGIEQDEYSNSSLVLFPEEFTQIDIYDSQGAILRTFYDKNSFNEFCSTAPEGLLIIKTTMRGAVSVKKVVFVR